MSTETTGAVDLVTLRTALEASDAETLIGLYAEDAELQVIDRINQPSKPLIFQGKDAIAGYWHDVCGQQMAHVMEHVVAAGDTGAYSEACRYPDGTRVQCSAFLDLLGGKIARQRGVQAWDE